MHLVGKGAVLSTGARGKSPTAPANVGRPSREEALEPSLEERHHKQLLSPGSNSYQDLGPSEHTLEEAELQAKDTMYSPPGTGGFTIHTAVKTSRICPKPILQV